MSKRLVKAFLRVTGIRWLLGRLVSYGLQWRAHDDPLALTQLLQERAVAEATVLLAHVPNCGAAVKAEGRLTITHMEGLVLGNNVRIGDGAFLNTRGGLVIADNTRLSRNITIHTSTPEWQGLALPADSTCRDKPVFIGRNVWIGDNVNIAPGVRIGDGAIVGMGATVAADIAPGVIVGPAGQVVGQRDQAHYARLDADRRWAGDSDRLLGAAATSQFRVGARRKGRGLFFVVSTGRAGSTSIANALGRHSLITCRHEPKLQLVRLSTAYAHGEVDRDQVMRELLDLYEHAGAMPEGIYGESDQKLANLIDPLAELFPECKFIWLIRNPVDAVNSMTSRGWYSETEMYPAEGGEPFDDPLYRGLYSEHRVRGDKIGDVAPQAWREMSPFARNCWYWNYWNVLIERQLSELPPERSMRVRLLELRTKISSVASFLGAPYEERCQVHKDNVAESRHVLLQAKQWTPEHVAAFERWCLPNARRWYLDFNWPGREASAGTPPEVSNAVGVSS